MPKQTLAIKRFDGVSTLIAKEDRPIAVMESLINLRPHHILGRAIKRDGYSSKLTTGLTDAKRILEFENKNSEQVLAVMDGDTFKESINTSGSYSALATPSNDERTSGSTINGDCFHPIIVNKELRAGAGNSASTQRPLWFGYISNRNRFADAVTITAGRYLDLQCYSSPVLLPTSAFLPEGSDNYVSSTGFDTDAKFVLWASPIYDGYQKGMPYKVGTLNSGLTSISTAQSSVEIRIVISSTNANKDKRITGFDLFIGTLNESLTSDYDVTPAYFLKRVDLNEEDVYFSILGNVGNTTANKVVINNYANWMSFDPRGMHVRASGSDYLITAIATDTPSAGYVELTVSPNAPDLGATDVEISFVSKWYLESSNYKFETFYDNNVNKLGSEMYDYLGIPSGDLGISDWRYKYSAWNGVQALYGGFPTDDNFSYASVIENPDVVPSLNIFRHKDSVKGYTTVESDFIVFTKKGVERISYVGTGLSQNDEYLDAVLSSSKSIIKINDDEIAFMSYNGAYLISGRRVSYIGEPLKTWWLDKLTDAQKEACVAGYNDTYNEVWFSFPSYTDSTFTAGIIMCFDLEAYRKNSLSGWWFIQTDKAITDFTQNAQNHTLACSATDIIDFDGQGSESISTSYRLKMLENIIPGRKVRWGRIFVGAETSDTISCALYFDGSATSVALTLNSDLNGLIRYLTDTLEIEITTPASTNDVEHKGLTLTFQPMRVK